MWPWCKLERETAGLSNVKWNVERRKQNFMPGIKNKIVVTTGASIGIGEATAGMQKEAGTDLTNAGICQQR